MSNCSNNSGGCFLKSQGDPLLLLLHHHNHDCFSIHVHGSLEAQEDRSLPQEVYNLKYDIQEKQWTWEGRCGSTEEEYAVVSVA